MKIHYLASFVFVGAILFIGAAKLQDTGSTTLTVVERATSDTLTDTGAEGDSVGDILTFANEVYDETNTTQVGNDSGFCMRTVAGEVWECSWTTALSTTEGSLMVEGPFYDTRDSVLTITGGTGAYKGARGQMSLHARNADGTEYDFVFEIMQ